MTIKSFSWLQILNPFNFSALKAVYSGVSTENRTSFWNITVSFVVAILTAWLGFTISNNIQTSNEQLNTRLLRYQVIDKFGLVHDKYSSYTLPFMQDMLTMYGKNFKKEIEDFSKDDALKFINYVGNNQKRHNIIQMGDSTVNIIRIIMPYLSDKYRNQAVNNNFLILTGCFTLKKLDEPKVSPETFIAEMRHFLFKAENAKIIGLNTITEEILDKGADLYTLLYNTKDEILTNSIAITSLMIQMIIVPTIENELFLYNDIYGEKEIYNPILDSTIILLCAFLISYMLYRILILKVFVSRINLRSSEDFEKVERQSRNLENETRLLRLEVSDLKRTAKENVEENKKAKDDKTDVMLNSMNGVISKNRKDIEKLSDELIKITHKISQIEEDNRSVRLEMSNLKWNRE